MKQDIRQDVIVAKSTRSDSHEVSSKVAKKGGLGKRVIIVVLSILFVLALAAAVVLFVQYQKLLSDPASATAAQTTSLVKQVGKLIALPNNETPTIATVSDKSKLSDQPFFAKSKDGDKLLIYTNAKQAIIYRPSTNQIINVGPIAINSSSSTSADK